MTSIRSLRGLDWLTFFVADVQTGFGAFVSVYLTTNRWTQDDIGQVLSLGTVVALVTQIPGGALVDWLRSKRTAATLALASISGSALLLALRPDKLPVYVAEFLHGFASCVLTPSIAAISLALVGRAALGERIGRNARFQGVGNGLTAALLGYVGNAYGSRWVFVLTAALSAPAVAALRVIGPVRVPRLTEPSRRTPWRNLGELFGDRHLLAFCGCAFFFHLANAAMLPVAAAELTRRVGDGANAFIAACVVVPQFVVAGFSPYVGRQVQSRRRLVLLIGWLMLPLRAALMTLFPDAYVLVGVQVLSGVSAAVFGVALPVVAADVTRGTGRFNLAMGVVGVTVSIGAALSTLVAGRLGAEMGVTAAYAALGAAGLAGTALVWVAIPHPHVSSRRRTARRRAAEAAAEPAAARADGDQTPGSRAANP